MLSALFALVIQPIVQILEFFFTLFREITKDAGLSVVGLSLVVTLCTLPLYIVAEKWQEAERQIEDKLRSGIARIKRCFRGDERFMILSTFYRQNHYHPLMALRSSFSLLIQIPFFIAAYSFLSHLESLKGVSFLFVRDFGSPDAAIKVGSLCVNVLPILMTAINCVSGAIYSKGHGVREKVQIFGCALVFLALLYNSPAGLVVYWTMNNVFSLVKNIFYKIKNLKKVLYILLCAVAVFCLVAVFTVFHRIKSAYRILIFVFALALPLIPFVVKWCCALLEKHFSLLDENKRLRILVFTLSAVLLALLSGLEIPSMLMESEPEQYCYVENYSSPFVFLRYTFFQAVGLFVFWPACFFALFSLKVKKALCLVFPFAAFAALVNTFAFSGSYGPILPECIFMQPQLFSTTIAQFALNALAIVLIFVLTVLLLSKKPKVITGFCAIAALSLVLVSVRNITSIGSGFKKMSASGDQLSEIKPAFHLSKTGRNVIVIMQDRLFMPFVEECFKEKPEFRQAFDGFTFYKNTVSFGKYTMVGTPGIFGGYSFTPYEINRRGDQTLQEKHNQALLTLPVVFHKAGFETTVAGLPYENYLEYPTEKMYEGYEFVNRVETRGAYSDLWYSQNGVQKALFLAKKIKRNMIWFSIFKMVSPVLRRAVYHEEYWTAYDSYSDGIPRFIDNYSELDFLPQLTDTASESDSFVMIDNEVVHESILLDYPDYVPTGKEAVSFGNGRYAKNDHYTTMMAVFNMYEKFFAYLKDIGCYDNTRIIVVSDHGTITQVDELENDEKLNINKQNVVASLLVKDFGEHGEVKTDMTFMTNADTPYLATRGIIENASNPFTGLPFKIDDKNSYVKILTANAESTRIRKRSAFSSREDEWYCVHDDIFKNENWSLFKGE